MTERNKKPGFITSKKDWERNHRDYSAKIIRFMHSNTIVEQIISKERLEPYLNYHRNDLSKALAHYKSNILISESFYPLLAILEVGLRNSMDYQLTKKFNDRVYVASFTVCKSSRRTLCDSFLTFSFQ